ncbi:FAD-binding protein [Ulvibacter antarcticus]|uniref:FAD binding domain-containing protein n=1 Tax=Ulvibacter antarcticus TaxID=442714 RepID=A0A3L9YV47_9FLAO|nr:FAD-binding protein [Ulvibacter antarcticus]RMA64393.1 FAD binding domain-containing protein [Ulvibacter antarcticus]
MATTTIFEKQEWDTLHKNGPFPLKRMYVTRLEGRASIPSSTDRYNDAAVEIQRIIKDCADQNEGFRAYGSRWSMSSIAHQKDNVHQNNLMNLDLNIFPQDLHALSSYNAGNLFFFECGNTIKEISQKLEEHGKSLKTTGASNGQTIAGCISTGVHGSALNVGSVQDYIVGLNIITGPSPADNVYLERHTKPGLTNAFAEKINAKVIRNDELFNAALVGLGSFGFIHGIVLEAEDLYLLKRYVRKINKNLAMKLSNTMDFKNSEFKIAGETDSQGNPLTPYHFKVFINPYTDDSEYVVEAMYKKPYQLPYPDPFTTIEKSIYKDLIYLLISISEKFPNSIPWFIKRLEKSVLPNVNEETIGTLYETFWDAAYQGPAFAMSIGVDHSDSEKALNILTKMTKKDGPIPGIFAMRFVKQSEATLAFTKFPITCMIEIDGIIWSGSNKLISMEEYSTRMLEVLKNNNIPFTIHWGKISDWAFPDLATHMFGNKVEQWKALRGSLLSKKMQQVFSNKFLDTLKLSDIQEDSDPDLIASLL